MTIQHIIMMVVLIGGGLGYTLYMTRRMKAGMPEAFRMFFERTGYRYADIAERPLEDHVMHGENLMKDARNGYHIHMVRDFHGFPVHNIQDAKFETITTPLKTEFKSSMSASWNLDLQGPPAVMLQIADKKLTRREGAETGRLWSQKYPQQVPSGDPELDKRFACYGTDPNAVQRVLATPGLKELLSGCTEVDLVVYPDRVVFSDPEQKNMTAGLGGTIGNMAMGTNMMKRMEATIPVHDRIAELLATTARACA